MKGYDNEYYLIDLDFPQINVGVEVDEAFHKNNHESDLKRELTIEEKLSSIREDNLFELKRIDATLPLGELSNRIEVVANEIKQKILEQKITQWDTDISIQTQIKKKDVSLWIIFIAFALLQMLLINYFSKIIKATNKLRSALVLITSQHKCGFQLFQQKKKKNIVYG